MKDDNSITYHSKAMANVKVFADKQTDKQTDRQTDRPKTICPHLLMPGHKNLNMTKAGIAVSKKQCRWNFETLCCSNFPGTGNYIWFLKRMRKVDVVQDRRLSKI